MIDNIYDNMDKKNTTIGVFLDLQKAFDTVDHEILLYKMHLHGVRGIVLHWSKDYLTTRQQFVTYADVSSDLGKISCGVPQGSVLGPLLFLLYVNDISNSVPNASIKLFPDDANLFVHGITLDNVVMKGNASLRSLSNWFYANKLSLSIDKTSYSIFGKSARINHNYTIQLCDSDIKQVNCSKYLVFYVDSNLDWKDHIDFIYKKLIKFISIFY